MDYTVKITFTKQETGAVEYQLPYVFHVSDPKEGMKATVIRGTRGDGSIVIPGGKRSQVITIRGKLVDADGYKDLTTLINEMRDEVTTDIATLTMKRLNGETGYVNDWSYTVRRIEEIRFPKSMRISSQDYEVSIGILIIRRRKWQQI